VQHSFEKKNKKSKILWVKQIFFGTLPFSP
jgi:hypothetical protein